MDEKTLEEKLASVNDELYLSLEGSVIGFDKYIEKTNDLLLEEGIVDQKKGIEYKDPTGYIGERLLFGNHLKKFYFGLKNHYVAPEGAKIEIPQIKEDIDNYNKIYELSKEYITNELEPEKLTETQFRENMRDYIFSQEEVKDIEEERKNYVVNEMISGLTIDLSLIKYWDKDTTSEGTENSKKDYKDIPVHEYDYNGFTHVQLDKALDKVIDDANSFEIRYLNDKDSENKRSLWERALLGISNMLDYTSLKKK